MLFAAALAPVHGQVWNTNLVVNGDAEAGPGATSRSAATPATIPGWTKEGAFTVVQYGSPMLLSTDAYGPQTRGKNYFAGGPNGGKSTATQTIDLSAGAVEIDAGRVRFYLSAFLSNGGNTGSGTESKLTATFLDAAGKTLLEQQIKAHADLGDGNLLARGGSGFLLPNTRKVRLVLDLTRAAVAFNVAAADNISLVLALEPILGANLAVNPGGEATKGESSHNTAKPVPGWNAPYSFGVASYSTGNIRLTDPGPEDRGVNNQNYFFARTYGKTADAQQNIDVTLAKDRIDAGGVTYKLSAWVGGEGRYDDPATVKVIFYDANGAALGGTGQVGPVTAADRAGKDALLFRAAEGTVPPGTRVIEIRMTFASASGSGHPAAEVDNVTVTLHSGGQVAIKDKGIVHAATAQPGGVAPGQMLTIYTAGINLASTTRMQLDSSGLVATTLGDVRVFFDGTQAPLIYVNSSEIGAVAPFNLEGKSATKVRVEYKGVPSAEVEVPVAATNPGIFTLDGAPKGPGLIFNEGYVPNGKDTAAGSGTLITLYWTGGGPLDPAGRDGRIEMTPLSRPISPVSVTIGGQPAELIYAGGVPYAWSGLLTAVARVPAGLATEEPVQAPVVITAGDASSPDNTVTVWVKP